MKLGYATACLDVDEQRGQTDARVRGPARALEWAGKSGLASCVRGRPGPGRRGQLIHSGEERQRQGWGVLNPPHWLFVSNGDDIPNHNNGNSQQAPYSLIK